MGSDDFLFPSLISFTSSFVGAVLFSVLTYLLSSSSSCSPSSATSATWLLETYVYGSLALSLLSAGLSASLAYASSRGRIMEPSKRSAVAPLSLLWLASKGAHVVFTCVGTYWATTGEDAVEGCGEGLLGYCVVMGWVVFVLEVLGVAGAYQCVGGGLTELDELRAFRRSPKYVAANRSRLAALACIGCVDVDGEKDLVLGDAAVLFSRMFQDADVVQSDILAGLKATYIAQKTRARNAREALAIAEGRNPAVRTRNHHFLPSAVELDQVDDIGLEQIHDIQYYGSYAMAVYGWPLYAHINLCITCGKGIPKVGACACCDPCCADKYAYQQAVGARGPVSVGDNPCGYNVHTMRRFLQEQLPESTPVDQVQIIYSNYDNCVFQPIYLVAADHVRKTIVVSVRGTLSMDDVFTDVTAFPSPLDEDEWFGPIVGDVLLDSGLDIGVKGVSGGGGGGDGDGDDDDDTLDNTSWSSYVSEVEATAPAPARARLGRVEEEEGDGSSDDALFHRSLSSGSEQEEEEEEEEEVLARASLHRMNPDDEMGGMATDLYAHMGMVRAAKWIRGDLVSRGIMGELQAGLQVGGEYEEWDVVVTGHSLGAGSAVLLAALLRKILPRVKCFAFSPPAVGSPRFRDLTVPFVTSVVLGKDCVVRLSERTGHELRDELAENLFRSQVPKHKLLCGLSKEAAGRLDMSGSTEGWPNEVRELYEDWTEANAASSAAGSALARAFAPPGRVLHLVQLPNPNPRCCPRIRGRDWNYIYTEVVDPVADFASLRVSPMMVRDHMPWNIFTAVGHGTKAFELDVQPHEP